MNNARIPPWARGPFSSHRSNRPKAGSASGDGDSPINALPRAHAFIAVFTRARHLSLQWTKMYPVHTFMPCWLKIRHARLFQRCCCRFICFGLLMLWLWVNFSTQRKNPTDMNLIHMLSNGIHLSTLRSPIPHPLSLFPLPLLPPPPLLLLLPPQPHALQYVLYLAFQHNLPQFPTVSGHCPPVFYSHYI